MDPRKPKRPEGDAGSNWARCCDCGREASSMRAIRHAKGCGWKTGKGGVHTIVLTPPRSK